MNNTPPLLIQDNNAVYTITFNRVEKHNAWNPAFLHALQQALEHAIAAPHIRFIVLQAHGKHFSVGADLTWMQAMVQYTPEENRADAEVLARLLYTLHHAPKPTIAIVHGCAYGGGAGLVAACDIAIATQDARFCFSEVRWGLIPAVVSPYVIQAIGARAATWLFTSADAISAARAEQLGLVHHCIPNADRATFTETYLAHLHTHAPQAVQEAKQLARYVAGKPIDTALVDYTATSIAQRRVSAEAQTRLQAFLRET